MQWCMLRCLDQPGMSDSSVYQRQTSTHVHVCKDKWEGQVGQRQAGGQGRQDAGSSADHAKGAHAEEPILPIGSFAHLNVI